MKTKTYEVYENGALTYATRLAEGEELTVVFKNELPPQPTTEERLATLEDRLEFLMGHRHLSDGMLTEPPASYGENFV